MTGTLYVSGPMSGRQDFNYPAFREAAARLRAFGYTVLDPSEVRRPSKFPEWGDWMRSALTLLLQCDAVAVLPGWSNSNGAEIEVMLAKGLGMEVRTVDEWEAAAPLSRWQALGVIATRAERLEEEMEEKEA